MTERFQIPRRHISVDPEIEITSAESIDDLSLGIVQESEPTVRIPEIPKHLNKGVAGLGAAGLLVAAIGYGVHRSRRQQNTEE